MTCAPLYIASGSEVFSPSRYAGVGAAGHSSASYCCRAAPISRCTSVRTCVGQRAGWSGKAAIQELLVYIQPLGARQAQHNIHLLRPLIVSIIVASGKSVRAHQDAACHLHKCDKASSV